MKLIGNCTALGIGSLPDTNAVLALERIFNFFPKIPFWPQLPKRSYFENMYLQFSEHIPGRCIDIENKRFYIDKTQDLQPEMEGFFNDYLANDLDKFKISRDYCEGLYTALDLAKTKKEIYNGVAFIKGQITGPISFGLQVVDENKKPIYYDDMFHDILLKNLQCKARWQEEVLSNINKNIIISVDEPYLSSVGSGVINLNRAQVIEDIEAIFKVLKKVKATHCCGNTDWSLLMATSADILLFDAYNYAKNISLFTEDLKDFLARGGCLGWGIIPTTGNELENCSKEALILRLEEGIDLLVKKGLDHETIIHQSFITPACGLGNLPIELANTAMQLTRAVSEHIQAKYNLN